MRSVNILIIVFLQAIRIPKKILFENNLLLLLYLRSVTSIGDRPLQIVDTKYDFIFDSMSQNLVENLSSIRIFINKKT